MKDSQGRTNQITSLLAIAISVVAMLVSILEVSAVREQQRADVWPYIELSQHYTGEGYALRATNKGVGPALVGSVKMYQGERVIDDLQAFIAETLGPDKAFGYDKYGASDPSNAVMAAGESVDLFRVPWTPDSQLLLQRWDENEDKIDVRLCFCSIHEDCWKTTLLETGTSDTNQCR